MASATNQYVNPGDLATKAMLVSINIKMFGNRRLDKKVSGKATADHGVGERAGRFNKWLLIQDLAGNPADEYQAIVSARNKLEVVHRELSSPWLDGGTRIITSAIHTDWALAINEQKTRFNNAVDIFVAKYPELVRKTRYYMEEIPLQQGKPTMFDPRQYPSQEEVKAKFKITVTPMPLPSGADFRCNLTSTQVELIKLEIEESMQKVVQNCTEELFERLSDLSHRVVKLADPKAIITDSLVRDVSGITKIVKKLNFGNSSYLDAMADRIVKELSFDKNLLKASPEEREALAAKADKIIEDMAGFMGDGDEY